MKVLRIDKEYYKVISDLKEEIKELKDSIFCGQVTHSNMMEEQNTMIKFMQEKGILTEYYQIKSN